MYIIELESFFNAHFLPEFLIPIVTNMLTFSFRLSALSFVPLFAFLFDISFLLLAVYKNDLNLWSAFALPCGLLFVLFPFLYDDVANIEVLLTVDRRIYESQLRIPSHHAMRYLFCLIACLFVCLWSSFFVCVLLWFF